MIKKELTTVAYFAGLLDGEGCINVSSRLPRGGKNPSYRLTVIIANNVLMPLAEARAIWGGALHNVRPGHWQWRLSGRDARAFLSDVQTFLRIKRAQCDVALAFQTRIDARPKLDAREIAEREAIKVELSALKRAA